MGRHPATLGVVDHHAGGARLRLRGRDAARGGRRLAAASRSTRATVSARRRVSPPSGTRLSPSSPSSTPVSRPRIPPAPRRRLAGRRGGDGHAATGPIRKPDLRAGRLGVRVRERPLPGRRRHGRRRPGPAPTRPWRRRRRPRTCLDGRHAVAQRRLGRLRRRQRGPLALQASVLRLRQGHRRAERGRHRARIRRCWRRNLATRPRSSAGSSGCSPSRRQDGSWFGRWGVNHVYGTGAALPLSRRAASRPITRRCDGRSPGSRRCSSPTGASVRTFAPMPTRAGAAVGTRRLRRPPGHY